MAKRIRPKPPTVPPEADATPRQELVRLLQRGTWGFEELQLQLGMKARVLEEALRHVEKSGKHTGAKLVVVPATCGACGFVFKGREVKHLHAPSKCPECRSERIDEPRFTLEGGKPFAPRAAELTEIFSVLVWSVAAEEHDRVAARVADEDTDLVCLIGGGPVRAEGYDAVEAGGVVLLSKVPIAAVERPGLVVATVVASGAPIGLAGGSSTVSPPDVAPDEILCGDFEGEPPPGFVDVWPALRASPGYTMRSAEVRRTRILLRSAGGRVRPWSIQLGVDETLASFPLRATFTVS